MAYRDFLLALSSGNIVPLSKQYGSDYISVDTNIKALMNLLNGDVVAPRYRLFILNPDDTVKVPIPIEDIISDGNYTENYQNGQRASLSFTLYNQNGRYTPTINQLWANARVRLDAGVEQQDGAIVWAQKGIFVLNNSNPVVQPGNYTVSFSADDKFGVLERGPGLLEYAFEVESGVLISSLVKELLATQRGDGYPLDSQEPYFYPSLVDKRTQAKISKTPGESVGSIILTLAEHMGAEVFYNAQGRLCFYPLSLVGEDKDKPILFHYQTETGNLDGLSFSLNYSEIINKVVLVGSTVNGAVVRATAQNDDPNSPLSVQKIGTRLSVINDSSIQNKIVAEENARYQLRQKLVLKSSVNLTTPFSPIFGVNNLILVSDNFFKLEKQPFLIQSVNFSLNYGGTMSLSVSNIDNLPFTVGQRA